MESDTYLSVLKEYYNILKISKTATLADIKQAYRSRAKELHPDVNNRGDAHDQFILLNEAYDYFKNRLTGKVYNNKTHSYQAPRNHNPNAKPGNRGTWDKSQRNSARKRAREHADMKYKEYLASDHYKQFVALDTVVDAIIWFTFLLVIIITPLGMFPHSQVLIFPAVILVAIALPLWLPKLPVRGGKITPEQLYEAFIIVAQTGKVTPVITGLFNLIILSTVFLDTVISFGFVLGAYFIGGFVWTRWKEVTHWEDKLRLWLIKVPSMISLLLLFNFMFSWNTSQETYFFTRNYVNTSSNGNEPQLSSTISLKDGAYKFIPSIRTFSDNNEIPTHAKTITYSIETGLLGLPVLVGYRFRD